MNESAHQQAVASSGAAYTNRMHEMSSVMQLRLETEELHRQIEEYLRGYRLALKLNETTQQYEELVIKKKPLVNEQGVSDIMQKIKTLVNAQTVQGNWTEIERYDNFILRFHESFAEEIFRKRPHWSLSCADMRPLCKNIVHMVEIFLTRPIGDGERRSYTESLRSNETVVQDQKQGIIGGLFRRNR